MSDFLMESNGDDLDSARRAVERYREFMKPTKFHNVDDVPGTIDLIEAVDLSTGETLS